MNSPSLLMLVKEPFLATCWSASGMYPGGGELRSVEWGPGDVAHLRGELDYQEDLQALHVNAAIQQLHGLIQVFLSGQWNHQLQEETTRSSSCTGRGNCKILQRTRRGQRSGGKSVQVCSDIKVKKLLKDSPLLPFELELHSDIILLERQSRPVTGAPSPAESRWRKSRSLAPTRVLLGHDDQAQRLSVQPAVSRQNNDKIAETKPSSQDGGDKKDGEYIKLKVIGQVTAAKSTLRSNDDTSEEAEGVLQPETAGDGRRGVIEVYQEQTGGLWKD
ncbi:hypothetical protein F7725_008925 [Dissostichus mawsoni]|uniref:Uncharacterized protein n=1 Tax=Dissostichus mawsoni TaxID=36200 RepID=A0A7J5Z613_DISMA|nr:hypothetical protein F7725_008925 [Dissostichus mawsoni]